MGPCLTQFNGQNPSPLSQNILVTAVGYFGEDTDSTQVWLLCLAFPGITSVTLSEEKLRDVIQGGKTKWSQMILSYLSVERSHTVWLQYITNIVANPVCDGVKKSMKFKLENSLNWGGQQWYSKFGWWGGARMMRCVPPFEWAYWWKSLRNEPSNTSELSAEDLLAVWAGKSSHFEWTVDKTSPVVWRTFTSK